jgi:type IV secretory pathway VirB2 component (pilin)
MAMHGLAFFNRNAVLAVFRRGSIVVVAALGIAASALAQGNSPWENAVNFLHQAFTSPIGKGLALHKEDVMNKRQTSWPHWKALWLTVFSLLLATPLFAQANSPWENAVTVLQQAFTSTIARGLSLVAIVVSGLTFAFGEGGSKRVLAGVLFGVGMAIAAVNFLAWLFPA